MTGIDLRTRIAAAIALHPQGDEYGLPDGTCRGCGWPKKQSDYGIDYSEHVADAVIRELQLTVLGDGIIVGAIVGESHA